MRKANERPLDSGIYARLLDVQMTEGERFQAIGSMQQAEKIVDTIVWIRTKLASIGNAFLKPSLKH